jgi:hypothetical protein
MAAPHSWLNKASKDLKASAPKSSSPTPEEFRSQIQRYKVLEAMHSIYEAINQEAGAFVLRELLYLPPQNLICTYTYARNCVDYQMELALTENGPTLFFSRYKTNRTSGGRAMQESYRLFGNPARPKIKHQLRIYPAIVNDFHAQEWFTYLLSGLRHSRKPSQPHFELCA